MYIKSISPIKRDSNEEHSNEEHSNEEHSKVLKRIVQRS